MKRRLSSALPGFLVARPTGIRNDYRDVATLLSLRACVLLHAARIGGTTVWDGTRIVAAFELPPVRSEVSEPSNKLR